MLLLWVCAVIWLLILVIQQDLFDHAVGTTRMITSYFNFPMKRLLRYLGKALRFMLLTVHEKSKMNSFTLFRLCDFKSKILQLKSMDNRKHLKVWQTDPYTSACAVALRVCVCDFVLFLCAASHTQINVLHSLV